MPEQGLALSGENRGALQGSAAAAVLLMLFDEDEAAQILSRLEPRRGPAQRKSDEGVRHLRN
jgi:flagellar motor switch protein FliG